MSLSLNEAEAVARKAARGTGYSWGISEEAGKATRWLCAHGIDGCATLARLLGVVDGVNKTVMTPVASAGIWSAPSGQLCPLMTGSSLSDFAFLLGQRDIETVNVIQPGLLLPFAAVAARQIGNVLTLDMDGVQVVTDGQGTGLSGTASLPEIAARVIVRRGGGLQQVLPFCSRATPDVGAWRVLNQFAARTYAPASEQSRLLGAGAGNSDID